MAEPLSLTVIVLTYNEELHLRRCLQSVADLAARIIVVDSFSSDETEAIAREFGAEFVARRFVNQAEQFNWALENFEIADDWILRLDADEYLLPELRDEMRQRLPQMDEGVTGIQLKRRVIFRGTWIRFGGYYPTILLRLFRPGTVRVEQLWMDEHIVSLRGAVELFENDFCDHNLNDISWWTEKHNRYATRKMADYWMKDVAQRRADAAKDGAAKEGTGRPVRDFLQYTLYRKFPLYLRPLALFAYRYVLRLGLLHGTNGFLWIFFQSRWYPMLIDAKLSEARRIRAEGGDEAVRHWLEQRHNLALPKE